MKVFVGMSGGVDSSVSAALLQQAGYNVTGVFIKVWEPEGYVCTWREDRRDAMRVAALLNIPFVTLDLEKEYKKGVVDYMLSEYKAGRTPNPDVMCNKQIKFGAFFDKAMKLGADYVATGHYSQIRSTKALPTHGHGGKFVTKAQVSLLCSTDKSKDQSYFLWTLGQKQLNHTLFPIGNLPKSDVRKLARKFKLPNAEKKDSQGLCFIGKLDVKEFLAKQLKPKAGKVLDTKGKVIGEHAGAILYTIGERHGFKITSKTAHDRPYYIVAKDQKKNVLIVTHEPAKVKRNEKTAILEQVNWTQDKVPDTKKSYQACLRYHGEPQVCKINIKGKVVTVTFKKSQTIITPGQSLVLYDGDICLGGGVIK